MAERNAGTVAIRLDLRGREELHRRLSDLGAEGERMARDLERAMQPVERQYDAMGDTIEVLTDNVQDLAAEAGPLGRIISGLGPVGMAAAAGFGALALAAREFFVLMTEARETAFYVQGMENVARATEIAETRVMSFASAITLAGGEGSQAFQALEEFSKRIGEFRVTGAGEARDGLEALGLEALGLSEAPIEQVFDRVLEQLAQIEDPARRLAISDKLGLRDAGDLLQQTADDLQRFLDTAESIDGRLSSGALARFADAASDIREAQLRQERARQLQSLAALDAEVVRAEALAGLEEWRATQLAGRVPLAERETSLLELQAARAEALADQLSRVAENGTLYGDALSDTLHTLEEQRRLLAEVNGELDRRAAIAERDEIAEQRRQQMIGLQLMHLGEDPAEDRADGVRRMSLERRRELEALIATQLQAQQTPLERLLQLENDLTEAREAGLDITQAQIDQIVETERAALLAAGAISKLTDEEQKLFDTLADPGPLDRQKSLLEDMLAPTEELRQRVEDLQALLSQHPEHSDIIKEELAAAREQLFGSDDGESSIARHRFQSLEKMAEDARNADAAMERLATGGLGTFRRELLGLIEGTRTWGDVFENTIRRIAMAWVENQINEMIIGPLAGWLGGSLGGWMGGGNSSAKAGVRHTGGGMDGFGEVRSVPLGAVAGAPRYHSGNPFLGADEHLFIGKTGESVLNPSENTALYRMLNAKAQSPRVNVNVHNAPQGVDVRTHDDGMGGVDIELVLDLAQRAGAQGGAQAASAVMAEGQRGLSGHLRTQRLLEG